MDRSAGPGQTCIAHMITSSMRYLSLTTRKRLDARGTPGHSWLTTSVVAGCQLALRVGVVVDPRAKRRLCDCGLSRSRPKRALKSRVPPAAAPASIRRAPCLAGRRRVGGTRARPVRRARARAAGSHPGAGQVADVPFAAPPPSPKKSSPISSRSRSSAPVPANRRLPDTNT